MSNGKEMASVPRELLVRWLMDFGRTHAALIELKEDTRAILAQSADQPQSEPVVLPARKGTHLRYDTLMPTFSKGWNACLDELAKLGTLYTHQAPADPGEVERMRASAEPRCPDGSDCCIDGHSTWCPNHPRNSAALSASAEPSAPVERDERADFDKFTVSKGRPIGYSGWKYDFSIWKARAALPCEPSTGKDARRYRWIKAHKISGSIAVPGGWIDASEDWDSEIDREMERKP